MMITNTRLALILESSNGSGSPQEIILRENITKVKIITSEKTITGVVKAIFDDDILVLDELGLTRVYHDEIEQVFYAE